MKYSPYINNRGNIMSRMSDFIIEKQDRNEWHEDWDSYWDNLPEYRADIDAEVADSVKNNMN